MNDDDLELGHRLGTALRERVETVLVEPAPVEDLRAHQRRRQVRHRITAVAAAVVLAAGVTGVVVTRPGGGGAVPIVVSGTADQVAEAVGRHALTMTDGLRVSEVYIQPTSGSTWWQQVWQPPGAARGEAPYLLVSTFRLDGTMQDWPPPDAVEVGGRVGTDHELAGVRSFGWFEGDVMVGVTASGLDDAAFAAAVAGVQVGDGRAELAVSPAGGWEAVFTGELVSGPSTQLMYLDTGDDPTTRQVTIGATVGNPDAWSQVDPMSEVIDVNGRPTLLVKSSDGVLLRWWDGDVELTLQTYGLTVGESIVAASRVTSLDRGAWNELLASATTVNDLTLPGTSPGVATTASATTVAGTLWQDVAALADVPVGGVLSLEPQPIALVRPTEDTVLAIDAMAGNAAGRCIIHAGAPAVVGGVAFTNDCDGATYALDGACLAGCVEGLARYATMIRDGRVPLDWNAHTPGGG